MRLTERIKALIIRKKPEPVQKPEEPERPARIKKVCSGCGKTFSVDPSWEHIPNYCKECKTRFTQEKEKKQRAGAPRKITRKCRTCGRFFTFPSTLPHYPNYCSNCRKSHQAAMKEKYRNPSAGKKGKTGEVKHP